MRVTADNKFTLKKDLARTTRRPRTPWSKPRLLVVVAHEGRRVCYLLVETDNQMIFGGSADPPAH